MNSSLAAVGTRLLKHFGWPAIRLRVSAPRLILLQVTSYARPGKLFTASTELVAAEVGMLNAEALTRIVDAVVALLRSGLASASESEPQTLP